LVLSVAAPQPLRGLFSRRGEGFKNLELMRGWDQSQDVIILRGISALGQFALGRVRCNQVAYFVPRRQTRHAQCAHLFGPKCWIDCS